MVRVLALIAVLATAPLAVAPVHAQEPQRPPPGLSVPLPQIFPIPKIPEHSNAGDVLRKFGLIGDFSADCSTPPGSPGHVVYTIQPNGTVLSVSQLAQGPQGLGGGLARYTFLEAEIISPTELKVRAFTSPYEGEVEVRFAKNKDEFRLVSSLQLGTGRYLIENSQHRGYTYKWIKNCGVQGLS
jgi:hypothetical protein